MSNNDFFPYGKSVLPLSVGFDRLLSTLENTVESVVEGRRTYPPYNIIRKDDTSYSIAVAIAGFSASELDIRIEKDSLIISGAKKLDITDDPVNYIYQGIALRDFSHKFKLADNVVVGEARVADGLLTVQLTCVIPDTHPARQVPIMAG